MFFRFLATDFFRGKQPSRGHLTALFQLICSVVSQPPWPHWRSQSRPHPAAVASRCSALQPGLSRLEKHHRLIGTAFDLSDICHISEPPPLHFLQKTRCVLKTRFVLSCSKPTSIYHICIFIKKQGLFFHVLSLLVFIICV